MLDDLCLKSINGDRLDKIDISVPLVIPCYKKKTDTANTSLELLRTWVGQGLANSAFMVRWIHYLNKQPDYECNSVTVQHQVGRTVFESVALKGKILSNL